MASVTLYPKYMTSEVGMPGLLSANGTGSDYRTLHTGDNDYGTIAFDTSPLHALSSACVLQGWGVAYGQRCNLDQWSSLHWKLTPRRITSYKINGNELTVQNYSNFGYYVDTSTDQDEWTDFNKALIDSENIGSYPAVSQYLFGGNNLLGFLLHGQNDHSVGNYKLYMRNLQATVYYTPRYYARFYNESGALVNEQLLEANARPSITDVLELLDKPGYDIKWWEIVEGDGKGEFVEYPRSSIDTDIGFKPYYVPKTYSIEVYPQRTDDLPGIYVEKKVNGAWNRLTPTRTRDYVGQVYAYYSGTHGDTVRFVADGYRSDQNLLVSKNQGTPVEFAYDGQPITVDEKTVDSNYYISIQEVQDVAFQISTSAGTGGTITAPQSVPRHGSADIVVTPGIGYELETVTIDGDTQEVDGTEPLTIPFSDVTAPHSVSATFAKIRIQIDLSGLPSGITVQGPNEVNYGDSQTWVFGCAADHSLLTITLDDIDMMDPVFKQVQSFPVTLSNITESHAFGGTLTGDLVTVTIQQTTGGTVTCAELPDGSGKFLPNVGALTFRATPNEYKQLDKWFNDANTESITLDVDGDLTVYAVFGNADVLPTVDFPNGKIIVTTPGPNYGKDVSTCYFAVGETLDYEVVPDVGYGYISTTDKSYIDIETIDGEEIVGELLPINTGSFSVPNVIHFKVTPRRLIYNVSAEVFNPLGAAHEVKVEPSGTHYYNDTITISATPAKYWHFAYWDFPIYSNLPDDAKYNPTIKGYAQDVCTDLSIPPSLPARLKYLAHFAQSFYDLTVVAGNGGKVTGGGQIVEGGDALLEITADYGYKVSDVLLDGNSVFGDVLLTNRGGTYELKDIDASHTVEVQFSPRFFTHNRKLLDYYPPVIKSIHEIRALMEALQVQDAAMFDAASFIFENQFIESASVEGVSRWERELGIIPAPTDTLRQRKERLRIKWVPKPRFTMQWLRKWLETVCGQAVRDPVLTDYSLRVTLPGGVDWMTIFDDLKRYKPANIVLDPRVLMPRGTKHIYVGTATMISNHDSPIIHTLTVEGE